MSKHYDEDYPLDCGHDLTQGAPAWPGTKKSLRFRLHLLWVWCMDWWESVLPSDLYEKGQGRD